MLSIIGILSILLLSYLFVTKRIKGQEYNYDITHDEFVEYRIKEAITQKLDKKVRGFKSLDLEYLSGKTFKLTGKIVYEGLLMNKIENRFECIATGDIEEVNPSSPFKINMFED